ncbi:hypothetical protein FHS16_006083 [Paenibacillus endophyticus]|uniref:Uncharacterized protein n=1 Tax=Paenibacillus endophyticus TaxID=1294268 RepID=A0A7W5GEB2_9BACL|nr:hypothetical protein [Paenibacillus endophyticus]MBB3155967.1 hypothetical protein [Paenibacillus endophyticus]
MTADTKPVLSLPAAQWNKAGAPHATTQTTMASYINYKLTPHIKHYSANKLNKSIYDALMAGNDDEAKHIAKSAYVYARSRMFDNGRF